MYQVSEAYKQQIREPFRNPCYIKVKFGIQDPEAIKNAVVSNNGQLEYSSVPDLNGESEIAGRYGTLEPGYWLLDGSMETVVNAPYMKQGYVGNGVSSETCSYAVDPVIAIQFTSGYYAFRGITFYFDEIENEHPVEIQIVARRDGREVFNQIFEVQDSTFTYPGNVPPFGEFLNYIELRVTNSGIPYRRARLGAIMLGVIKTLEFTDITEAKWSRKNDLLNSSIAKNEFSFTFLDTEGEYNPDNPEGIWGFLENGQEVVFEYGYELDDGTIEWIKGGTNYTDGEPSITNSAGLSQASFTAVSRLQSLSDEYRESIYYSNGRTLYDLADDILSWAGLVDDNGVKQYRITEKLKQFVVKAPLQVQEARAVLQLIANAGMCVVDVDRDGKIYIEEAPVAMNDFTYDKSVILDAPPATKKYPILKNILTTIHRYTVSSEVSELTKLDVAEMVETVYELNYSSPATEITVTGSGTVVISEQELYANMCRLTLVGTGTVTVSGKTIEDSATVVSFGYDSIGESCPVDNPLITDMDHAKEYAAWVAGIVQRRAEYTFKDRGFPEIDTTDNVKVDTLFTDQIKATVVENELSYNGAFSGNSKLLVINEVKDGVD